MSKHPTQVEGFNGSLEELASSIGNMTYEKVAEFTEKYAQDIQKQAYDDLLRGHIQLAEQLYLISDDLYEARKNLKKAWRICKPYMTDD